MCSQPLKWVWLGYEWSPCDDAPVLYVRDGGKMQVVRGHDLIKGVSLYKGAGRPEMGRLPHYYSCPILRQERREWAQNRRLQNA